MAQYINREKLLKRMEGYCKANCGCKPYEDALCPSCGLGDAIYMVEEQRIVNTRNMKRRKDAIEVVSKTEKTTRWIPVTERLPETPGEYMVAYHPCYWDRVHDEIKVGLDSFRGKTSWAKKKYQRVTHWMPLPDAPKEGE